MADEVAQLPSSPREDPPSLEASLSVTTPPSIERETNIMTKDELDSLIESFSFHSSVQIRLPEEDETIASTHSGEVAFYEAAFRAVLRFPIHPTIRKILYYYNIYPTQLVPNAWRSLVYVVVVWRAHKLSLSLNETSKDARVLKVPKSWGVPGKRYNKLPILSTTEQERLQVILDTILGENPFTIKEVFESKFFCKCFKVASQFMASNEGNKRDNPPPSSAAPIAGNEGESCHSRDEPRLSGPSQDDSVEYIGTIKKKMRRILPHVPDLTLLRWSGGKV
ncbi:hypothetical protein Acr_17g0005490 [Actinidia rufa]|uniref:Uncharacterized protein n=1 Tax=Actinidia rufa TaxID=165716 RepID=A0A7J0G2F8_9ERIC|nr:hypothetical protein Acr_17g0005490 [Actinidia rufa]